MPISLSILSELRHNNQPSVELSLYDQNLNDEDMIELAKVLQETAALITLNLTKNKITAVGVKTLLKLPLESLDLSFNPIGDAGAIELFQNSKITKLTLVNCNITDASMHYLATNKTIKYLNINYNPITPKIIFYIEKNNIIEKLIVNSPTNINSTNFKFLLFSINKHLKENKERLNQDLSALPIPQR